MPILEILLYPDPRLREKCKPVEAITPEIRKILDDMSETMYDAPGIGLAASQVGIMKRLIVVDVGEESEAGRKSNLLKLINPEIISQQGTAEMEEGCLSIPDIRDNVKRSEQVVVQALNERGEDVTLEAGGLLAVCLQHEIDHLNGVLFIDHLSRLKRDLIRSKLEKRERDDRRGRRM